MKNKRIFLSIVTSFILLGCADMPTLIKLYEVDDLTSTKNTRNSSFVVHKRIALDVPPELRADVQVPIPEGVAPMERKKIIPLKENKSIAGKAVSLDARLYNIETADVFSAVIDAMTALNQPVQSVDSPSGTVTTDWIRQGVDNINATGGMFASDPVRYRFVVRLFRQKVDASTKTRLEIRTIGQTFINRHWLNKSIRRKVSKDLFTAVEERLQIMTQTDL